MTLDAKAITEAMLEIKSRQARPGDEGINEGFYLNVMIRAGDRTVTMCKNKTRVIIPVPTLDQVKEARKNPDNFEIVEWRSTKEGRTEKRQLLGEWLMELATFGDQDQQASAVAIRDAVLVDVGEMS